MVLRIESPAPPIKVENWLLPLTKFQPAIVVFWATWSAACVAAMSYLAQLQGEIQKQWT